MSDVASLITAVSALAVAAGALVVSVGVFILVTKVANAIEGMGGGGDDS